MSTAHYEEEIQLPPRSRRARDQEVRLGPNPARVDVSRLGGRDGGLPEQAHRPTQQNLHRE